MLTLLVQQPYQGTSALAAWPQPLGSLSPTMSWQWIFLGASIPHHAPLPREQFEPRDAQATLSGHLIIAPLVEKYQLNLWLLVLRSELIGRGN